MEDQDIIDLYWKRDERAIQETSDKYGSFLLYLAGNILDIHEDAEECVNDTYEKAWNSIPPEKPKFLRAWLGRVVRNAALNRWDKNHAKKRYAGMEVMLDELEECIPDLRSVEDEMEAAALGNVISAWLRTLSREDRALFVRRYWNGEALDSLAKEFHIPSGKLAQRMYRLRNSLKKALEQEGVIV